ncbi:sulfurtransferase complex subunit TusC [Methylomonas sp. MgM2]
MKNYLFVMRQPPNLNSRVQETLDQMLTTAAFDQSVGVLFVDDGVYQLKRGQDSEHMTLKNTAAMFLALELYDIGNLFVEAESLFDRGLSIDDLILAVTVVRRTELNDLLKRHDVLISD